MFAKQSIIYAVLLCLLLSVFSSGFISASLDLIAFALLIIYLFKQNSSPVNGSHHKLNISKRAQTYHHPKRDT